MERSRMILLEISSASKQVITTASNYANWKGLRCVPRIHFQLENDMRRISVACDALADLLAKSSLTDTGRPEFDVRLQDWLCTEEPQICLDTLTGMSKLLRIDTSFWTMFNPWRGQPTQDRIKEAVELLYSVKDCFHFLFSTTAFDDQQHRNIPQSQNRVKVEGSANSESQSLPVPPESTIDPNLLDTSKQPGAERVIYKQRGEGHATEVESIEEISRWLDGLNCAEKQDMTLLLRQPDTCEWLFDTTQYKTWWNGESSCLWLRGKPGAGKSVLASSVIESLEKIQRDEGIIAFFYCDFRNERSTNASEVFRSLLSQLLRQIRSKSDFGSLLDDLTHAKDRGGATRNNIKELASFISRTAGLFTQLPLVVVDALDECKDVEDVLKGLVALQGHVRLFVTSRPLQAIKNAFVNFPSISMDDMADELSVDIALHVTRELAARRRLRDLDADVKTDIHATLCHRADGMFRWVECSIDTLNRCATMMEVHEVLANLPEGLDETYERILRAIGTRGREGQLALRALVWLVAALRPLKIQELMEGLSIDLSKRAMDISIGPMHREALLDACGSLVTYSEKSGIIILSHFSVKEYLLSELTYARLPEYHINWEQAHLQLIRLCMCYISICLNRLRGARRFGDTLVGSRVHHDCLDYMPPLLRPLRDYVMDDALGHFQHLGSHFPFVLHDIDILADVIEQNWCMWDNICLSTTRPLAPWEPIAPTWPVSKHDLSIYILVAFAPGSLFHLYLPRPILKPKKGTNPLIYTAHFNREEHARSLLSRGATLSCTGWEMDGSHQILPIEAAVNSRHETMVALFLAEGSPVPMSILRQHLGNTHSIISRRSSILTMLLHTDEFVEAVNATNDSVLGIESLDYHQDWGFLPNEDLVATIRRLRMVENGSLNDSHPFRPSSFLDFAMKFCGEDDALAIAKFLVEYHLVEFSDETLQHALNQGYPIIVQYLLSLGLSLPSDPLRAVLSSGSRMHRPPPIPTIRFLIDKVPNVAAYTQDGDSMLHIILRWSNSEDEAFDMTKRLIGYGCNPLEASLSGETPLCVALRSGYLSVARYLHSLGVALPPYSLSTVLESRSMVNQDSLVHFLIENGADAKASSAQTGDPILHLALKRYNREGALEVTKLLISGGCDPLQVDSSGQPFLHIAIKMAHTSVVQYLLSLGIPLPSDSLLIVFQDFFPNPRAREGIASLFRFLVDNGASIHAHTPEGDSVLHLALQAFYGEDALDITKSLISSGCSPLEADSSGKTPLRIAIEQGHLSVAEYLCSLGIPLPQASLCIALEWRDIDVVPMIHFLTDNGANINERTTNGDSLFRVALRHIGDFALLDVVKALVNCGYDLLQSSSDRESPLHIAICYGRESVVRYLLSLGIPLPPDSLLVASRPQAGSGRSDHTSQASIIRLLLDSGADVHACTAKGDTAFHVALVPDFGNHDEEAALEIAKVLVAGGCDPFQVPGSAESIFNITIERARTSTARYLISLGIPIPRLEDALLAVLNSYRWDLKDIKSEVSMIHFLIDNGADVRARTTHGNSALHLVLQSMFEEEDALGIAKRLIAGGCDPLQVDSDGRSVVQIAVTHERISIAQYLLSLGVTFWPDPLLDVFSRSRWYDQPQVSPAQARFLIENGADVHGCTSDGDSPFHIVLQSYNEEDSLEITKLLVNHKCDPLQINSSGDIPLHVALNQRYISVAKYLWSVDPYNTDYDSGWKRHGESYLDNSCNVPFSSSCT